MTIAPWLCLFAAVSFPDVARQAAAARESNRIGEAISLYREGVRMRPVWAEGWWYLGTLLYDQNRFPEGAEALARFVKIEPKTPPGWALLGLCEFETKRHEAALEHLGQSLTLGLDGNPALKRIARYHTALLLAHFSRFEAALQIYMQLATEGVDDPDIVAASGIAGLRMALLPKEVPPGQAALAAQVGRALFDTGARHPVEAKRDFEELIAGHPGAPEIHCLYGGFLMFSDPDAAIREWKRELEISPNHVPARLQLAYEYLKRGDAGSARKYAEEAVTLDPENFVARTALGRALLEQDQVKQAVAELEVARKLAPESPEIRMALASAYNKAGRAGDAGRERAEFLRLKKQRQP